MHNAQTIRDLLFRKHSGLLLSFEGWHCLQKKWEEFFVELSLFLFSLLGKVFCGAGCRGYCIFHFVPSCEPEAGGEQNTSFLVIVRVRLDNYRHTNATVYTYHARLY